MTAVLATGLATYDANGTVLDCWFPSFRFVDNATAGTTHLTLYDTPGELIALIGEDEDRGTTRKSIRTEISSLDDAPIDAHDAYLRLHLLSHRAVQPHGLNLDGVFGLLANVVWTNFGPCPVQNFEHTRARLSRRGPVTVYSIDKFPRMVDYVVPSGVRIGDADACVWAPTLPKAQP